MKQLNSALKTTPNNGLNNAQLRRRARLRDYAKYRYLYLLLVPAVAWYVIFRYAPMYGALIAFQDYNPIRGFAESPWVGFENFVKLFTGTSAFLRVLRNTIVISLLRLLFGFPTPIILALVLNEIRNRHYKSVTQTISYLPHFLSWVILAGVFRQFLSPSEGVVNNIITAFGGDPIYFIADTGWFIPVLLITGIWQGAGWGSIIYLAAISSIDPQLYEAAVMDGAKRLQQIWHITVPHMLNVVVIVLILNIGQMMEAGFDQIFNFYSPVVYEVADIIDTYVYRTGLINMSYSFSTAAGLFKNVVGFMLVLLADRLAKKLGQTGLF